MSKPTDPIELMAAAWRKASDGAYLEWDEIHRMSGVKDRELRQTRAAVRALADWFDAHPLRYVEMAQELRKIAEGR